MDQLTYVSFILWPASELRRQVINCNIYYCQVQKLNEVNGAKILEKT